jgi:hypothetical protein
MKRYNSTPWAKPTQRVPEVAELETSTPARPADLVADLVVPLGQAMITGALLGGVFVLALDELVPSFDGDLLKVWGMATLGISALAWVLLLADTRRLLWAIGRLTGRASTVTTRLELLSALSLSIEGVHAKKQNKSERRTPGVHSWVLLGACRPREQPSRPGSATLGVTAMSPIGTHLLITALHAGRATQTMDSLTNLKGGRWYMMWPTSWRDCQLVGGHDARDRIGDPCWCDVRGGSRHSYLGLAHVPAGQA